MFTSNYFWKNGLPVPRKRSGTEERYKIISDPYHKHITVEKYNGNQYQSTIYDSKILDFRKLKPVDQTGWSREETDHGVLIRDMDDRVIHIEQYEFEQSLCRACKIYSPHGWLAATHRLFYKTLGDAFNGVVLFDTNQKPVLLKQYQVDDRNEFTELLSEDWNMSQFKEDFHAQNPNR